MKVIGYADLFVLSILVGRREPRRYYYGGDAVCGATLKPLHLHNPSNCVGNMEVVDRLENV